MSVLLPSPSYYPTTIAQNASTAKYPNLLKGSVASYGAEIAPNAHDLSGHGYNGTFNNDTVIGTSERGRVWTFDGTGDDISTPLPFLTAPFTLSVWFYNTELLGAAVYNSFLSRGAVFENNTNFAFGWRRDNRRLFCYWRNGATLYGNEGGVLGASYYKTWRHAVAVIQANWDLSVYVDDELFFTDGSNSAAGDGSQPLRIGGPNSNTSTDKHFTGDISLVNIYDRALNSSERRELHEVTKPNSVQWARRRPIFVWYSAADASPATGTPYYYNWRRRTA
jgi:hypothetical protein